MEVRFENMHTYRVITIHVKVKYKAHSRKGCEGKKVKRSLSRPGVAQWVGRGIALLFHDRGTRRG